MEEPKQIGSSIFFFFSFCEKKIKGVKMVEYVVLLYVDNDIFVYIFDDVDKFQEFLELHKGEKMEIL